MSLSNSDRDYTAREFEKKLQESGLTIEQLREQSGLSEDRFMNAFLVSEHGVDPVDVWLLRDLLETAVKRSGGDFIPFSKLSETNRSKATGWFGVQDCR